MSHSFQADDPTKTSFALVSILSRGGGEFATSSSPAPRGQPKLVSSQSSSSWVAAFLRSHRPTTLYLLCPLSKGGKRFRGCQVIVHLSISFSFPPKELETVSYLWPVGVTGGLRRSKVIQGFFLTVRGGEGGGPEEMETYRAII